MAKTVSHGELRGQSPLNRFGKRKQSSNKSLSDEELISELVVRSPKAFEKIDEAEEEETVLKGVNPLDSFVHLAGSGMARKKKRRETSGTESVLDSCSTLSLLEKVLEEENDDVIREFLLSEALPQTAEHHG